MGIRGGTQEPSYRVIANIGPVEVRSYAPRLAASVTVQDDEVAARSDGFRRLARFIFGANTTQTSINMTAPVAQSAESEAIAMTAPVAQAAGPGGTWTISFFLPAKYTMATLPKPVDPGIEIHVVPREIFAVYRFSGLPNAGPVANGRAILRRQLAGSDWVPRSEPVTWFYDPPWTLPFARRNEVAVLVGQK